MAAASLVYSAFVFASVSGIKRPDYQGYDLDRPWFDGKDWAWGEDMFNQASLKPQETGTIQSFPTDSVPRTGAEQFIPASAMINGSLLRDKKPKNPTKVTKDSLAKGQFLFNTYCAVCHGQDGMGNTPVTKKGIPGVPIKLMFPGLTEPHLYNKIRYGGPMMPPYGFQTSQADRWNMVNYMKSTSFGKKGLK